MPETGKPIILSPATFENLCTADVVTPDGSVRYTKKGSLWTPFRRWRASPSMPLYIGKKAEFAVIGTIAPEGITSDRVTRPCGDADLRPAVCRPQKMSSGAMVDVDSGAELPEEPSETDNNASLTIPNQRIP